MRHTVTHYTNTPDNTPITDTSTTPTITRHTHNTA
jgi:hypothetical protein